MKTHTIADVRRNGNFYKFPNYVPETWSGTLIDMLSVTNVPAEDRIWAVTGLLDDRTNRLFAIWNARTAIERYDHAPDPRSITACDVAERYANGQATADELAVAEDAAWWAAKEYASAHPDIIITSVESARLAAANAERRHALPEAVFFQRRQ